MGCGEICAKAVIIIINIFFFIIGVAFLAAGCIYFAGKNIVSDYLETVFVGVTEAANSTSVPEGSVNVATQFLDIFEPVFIALLVLGIFMMITSILAMCGSCCSVACMLITYVVIVLIIFCAHLSLFIALMVGGFGGMIKDSLKMSIDKEYVGIHDTGPYSLGWNLIMNEYQCCGVDSYRDFNGSESWNHYPNKTNKDPAVTPVACCRSEAGELPESYDCAYNPTNVTSNWEKGCWEELDLNLVRASRDIVIGVNCGILGFELILAALALCVIFTGRKKDAGYNYK